MNREPQNFIDEEVPRETNANRTESVSPPLIVMDRYREPANNTCILKCVVALLLVGFLFTIYYLSPDQTTKPHQLESQKIIRNPQKRDFRTIMKNITSIYPIKMEETSIKAIDNRTDGGDISDYDVGVLKYYYTRKNRPKTTTTAKNEEEEVDNLTELVTEMTLGKTSPPTTVVTSHQTFKMALSVICLSILTIIPACVILCCWLMKERRRMSNAQNKHEMVILNVATTT